MRANRMPFGKFKGWPVDEIPEDYLNWLVENVDLREPLASAVYEALDQQNWCQMAPAPDNVKSIYRRLSLKWHPDKGGSTEAQQALNEFYQALTEKFLS